MKIIKRKIFLIYIKIKKCYHSLSENNFFCIKKLIIKLAIVSGIKIINPI